MTAFDIPVFANKALKQLGDAGYEAYLVGGCVRDLLLAAAPKDWDITTNAEPAQMQAVFHNCKCIATGLKHGTVTIMIDGEAMEITTFRIESGFSDNRHPDTVAFTKSLREDLGRRDFTMNAMAFGVQDGLIDYYGGAADIASGTVRCVGDPDRRFREDGLRILRALRFSAVLGFNIESGTAAAIFANQSLLNNVSAERINSELTKMLCGRNVGDVLRKYAQVLCVPLPEISPMIGFDQRNKHHCFDVWQHTIAVVENSPPTPTGRWSALLHDVGKPGCFSLDAGGTGHFYGHVSAGEDIANTVMRRLKFDNATRDRIMILLAHHDTPVPAEHKAVKRYLNRFGGEALMQLLQLFRADNLGQAPEYRDRLAQYDRLEMVLRQVLEEDACLSLKDLAVKGDDIITLGYQGKEIGKALNVLLEAVLDEAVENNQKALLDYLQKNFRK